MKIITTLFLYSFLAVSSFSQISTNGVYTIDGKTTEVEKKVYAITPTNSPTLVYFSNGLIAKVNTNADFSINSFFQEVNNIGDTPQKAKFGNSTLSATILNGTSLFSYIGDTNSSCVVSTPMVDIELFKGSFYFEVTEKKVIVACLEGSMKSYSGKKETILNAGQAVVCEPTTVGILEDKFEVGTGKINSNALRQFTSEVKDIPKNNILFIRINGKTVGVTL